MASPNLPARLLAAVRALAGATAYDVLPPRLASSSPEQLEELRKQLGGQLTPLAPLQTEWFIDQIRTASEAADMGDLSLIASLWAASRVDGVIGGLRKTRTAGLVALPKRFRGFAPAVEALKSDIGSRSRFDEMFPPSELAAMVDDGIGLQVSLGELVDVPGRDHPILVRQDPRFLRYQWNDGKWYFRSLGGMVPITPGLGKWVLHLPGGRISPWQQGAWRAVGRSFIVKEHSILARMNFSQKLANPARVAHAPNAAPEEQRLGLLRSLIAWGLNNTLVMPAGWQVELLESNGRGWEVFEKEMLTSDNEAMITLAGQVVTVTGGTGFANAGIHETIRADLIQEGADALAYTLNTQAIPIWAIQRWGEASLAESARVSWDTARPTDRKAEGDSLQGAAKAIDDLRRVLAGSGKALDVDELVSRFGIPTSDDPEVLAQAKALMTPSAEDAEPDSDPKKAPSNDKP